MLSITKNDLYHICNKMYLPLNPGSVRYLEVKVWEK